MNVSHAQVLSYIWNWHYENGYIIESELQI